MRQNEARHQPEQPTADGAVDDRTGRHDEREQTVAAENGEAPIAAVAGEAD